MPTRFLSAYRLAPRQALLLLLAQERQQAVVVGKHARCCVGRAQAMGNLQTMARLRRCAGASASHAPSCNASMCALPGGQTALGVLLGGNRMHHACQVP